MFRKIKLNSKKDFYYLFEDLYNKFGFKVFENGLSQVGNPDKYEIITKIKDYIEKNFKLRNKYYCLSYENSEYDDQKFEVIGFNKTCAFKSGLITWIIRFENDEIVYFARPEEIFYIEK